VEWFNWNRGGISAAYSLSAIVIGLLSLITGRLTDKFGPRLVIMSLGLLVGSGLLLMSTVSSVVHIYIIWTVIIGVGGSCSLAPILSTLPKWFTKHRGLALGIALAGFSLGGIIWPPVVQYWITNIGWQSAYIVSGVITLVIIIALSQLLRHSPQKIGLQPYGEEVSTQPLVGTPDQTIPGMVFRQAFRTVPYWLISLLRFCLMFVVQLITIHIFPHAVDIGFSETVAATILSTIAISSTVSRLLIGIIADTIGHRLTLFISAGILTLSLIILVFTMEELYLYISASLFGLAWGGTGLTASTVVAELFGSKSLGTILGSLEIPLTVGGAVGASITGIIFDATGSYTISFLICIILAILSLILGFALIRYRKTEIH
jgi:MFS family permease